MPAYLADLADHNVMQRRFKQRAVQALGPCGAAAE
jgi:hypothetical protein